MNLNINSQKIELSDRLRKKIERKFDKGLGRLLMNWKDDLKQASLSIEKKMRSGYEMKFDMNLPGASINVQTVHKVLLDGIVEIKNKAKRQLKKNIEKLRSR